LWGDHVFLDLDMVIEVSRNWFLGGLDAVWIIIFLLALASVVLREVSSSTLIIEPRDRP
jgi:hypothetical protein